jgi:hypothetical protein
LRIGVFTNFVEIRFKSCLALLLKHNFGASVTNKVHIEIFNGLLDGNMKLVLEAAKKGVIDDVSVPVTTYKHQGAELEKEINSFVSCWSICRCWHSSFRIFSSTIKDRR